MEHQVWMELLERMELMDEPEPQEWTVPQEKTVSLARMVFPVFLVGKENPELPAKMASVSLVNKDTGVNLDFPAKTVSQVALELLAKTVLMVPPVFQDTSVNQAHQAKMVFTAFQVPQVRTACTELLANRVLWDLLALLDPPVTLVLLVHLVRMATTVPLVHSALLDLKVLLA